MQDDDTEPKRPRPPVVPKKKREGWLELNEQGRSQPPSRFLILT